MTAERETSMTVARTSHPASAERAARRYAARLHTEPSDAGCTFVCVARLYGEGRLYLLLQGHGARLLVEQPAHLAHVRKGEHLIVTSELALHRKPPTNACGGEGDDEP